MVLPKSCSSCPRFLLSTFDRTRVPTRPSIGLTGAESLTRQKVGDLSHVGSSSLGFPISCRELPRLQPHPPPPVKGSGAGGLIGSIRRQIITMVFLEVELQWNVLITSEQLDAKGLILRKAIILRLLEDIANKKASKEHGYYVAVTTLNSIGEGKIRELTGEVLFPVSFNCITQKPCKGEILVGTVDKILKHGVFLKCGPIESIFLSEKMMKDYRYVAGENPMFMNDKLSKLEKEATVRFKVLGSRWLEYDREYQILATLAGDFLGPI